MSAPALSAPAPVPTAPTKTGRASRQGVIGDRMKSYEKDHTTFVKADTAYILRLDGHTFSTFTRPFDKPYDVRIHTAMKRTTAHLVNRYRCATGFTCSDEISLVFPLYVKADSDGKELYQPQFENSGKVQKLVSLSAGVASVYFYRYLLEECAGDEKLVEWIEKKAPHFDSRIFEVPKNAEIVNNLVWRGAIDYRRNAVSMLSHSNFSNKRLHGVNTKKQLEMLAEKGILWDEQPSWFRYGVFAKREKYLKTVEIKGETIEAVRTRITVRAIELTREYTQAQEDWLLAKEWSEDADSMAAAEDLVM